MRLPKVLVVTGTSTDVGKTIATAALLVDLRSRGARVAVVKPGRILFELEGVTQEVAQEAMKLAAQKLCILTKFVSRHSELR